MTDDTIYTNRIQSWRSITDNISKQNKQTIITHTYNKHVQFQIEIPIKQNRCH